jgi:small-conductance mechanosensitive channel
MQINDLPPILSNNVSQTGFILLASLLLRVSAHSLVRALVTNLQHRAKPGTNFGQRAGTIASIIKNTIDTVIFIIAMITIISQWGINIGPILTGAGILGLAVGFGSQTLVRDVVTGFFILLENQINIGDKVTIAGNTGVIIEMNLRTTVLVDDKNSVITIPNSQITTIVKLQKE